MRLNSSADANGADSPLSQGKKERIAFFSQLLVLSWFKPRIIRFMDLGVLGGLVHVLLRCAAVELVFFFLATDEKHSSRNRKEKLIVSAG